MTCATCEARREWVRKQYERSKERMQLCIERLINPTDRTEQPVNKPSDPGHPDQQ